MTRRRLLAAGLVGLPAIRRPSQALAADLDVAVIGAGAAGIGAGRQLKRLGKTFRIIEAAARPGGRVHTDTSLGQPFDAGAAYIHWNERNPWSAIARSLGVPTVDEPDSGGFRMVFEGTPPSDDMRVRRRAAFGRFSDLIDEMKEDAPDVSFAALAGDELMPAAAGMTLLNIGEEPEHVSVRDWQALWAGDDLVAPSGYGTLVARAAEGLPIAYDTRVTGIDWSGQTVRIDTDRGVVTAAAVIVTVSVGVLQAGAIRFTPRLPQATRGAIEGMGMGALTKIALRFDGERFGLPPHFDFFEVAGARDLMNAEAWGYDRDLVVCMVGGDRARDLCRRGEAAAVAETLDRVARMLGGEARKHFKAGRLAGWASDPLALGSYSYARVGRLDARAELARPVARRLWFAGEACAGAGSMTAGGATLAGERAAREIARRPGG